MWKIPVDGVDAIVYLLIVIDHICEYNNNNNIYGDALVSCVL